MQYQRFILGPIETNAYVLYNARGAAVVVDPVVRDEAMEAFILGSGLKVESIFITHAHLDHCYDAQSWAGLYKAPVYMNRKAEMLRHFFKDSCDKFGVPVREMIRDYKPAEGMSFLPVGTDMLRVLATPGHSSCSLSLVSDSFVVTGDVLFKGDIGRYDLPGAGLVQLYASLKKLAALPENLAVLPGHGEESTIAAERAGNEYLRTAVK